METFAQHYGAMCASILKRMPGADMDLIDEAKRQTMRAYDRCTFLYELLK